MSSQDSRDHVDAAARTLNDLFAQWRRNMELDIRVHAPATVVAYNPATQRADVMLGLIPVKFDGDLEVPEAPIQLPQIPVRFLGGGVSYATCPVLTGTTGHVSFSDRCLTQWLLNGGAVDPVNGRTHALADAWFEPGLRDTANAITPPTDLTAFVVEGPLVRLGSLATAGVVVDGNASLAASLTAAVSALATIAGTPIPEPPAPGAGAAIDGILAVLIPVLEAMAVSTKVFAAPTP